MAVIKFSLFAEQARESTMDKIGDALSKMSDHFGFAALAAEIDKAAPRSPRVRGRRPRFPKELIVRELVAQQFYNLSDKQLTSLTLADVRTTVWIRPLPASTTM